MFGRLRFLLLAPAALLCAVDARATETIRCGSRLIATEALAADILLACGQPDFRDVFSYPGLPNGNVIADEEQWVYNFGSNQLLRILKLRNGKLYDIRNDGYGFDKNRSGTCDPSQIVQGQSKYRLLSACGDPLTRRNLGYVQSLQPQVRSGFPGAARSYYPLQVYREEWVYNLGSRYLTKVVTIDNGVVSDVQNGERGSDTP